VAQKYDFYRNFVRPGEELITKAGALLPDGYVNQEWEKELTVEQSMLTAEDLKEITEKGFRYFKVKIDIEVKK
jgi:hypothetical protein